MDGGHEKTATLISGLSVHFCTFTFPVSVIRGQKGVLFLDFSVDMIRISTRVSVGDFKKFYLKIVDNPEFYSYIGHGISEYHYNFSVKENLGSLDVDFLKSEYNNFYFAYQHNNERSCSDFSKYTFVLEYNPNKCLTDYGILNYILKTFFGKINDIKLRSVDLCADFYDIPIDFFVFDKNRKRYVCDLTGNNGRTIYIGKRGSNGRVKIYDKAAETGSGGVWTRYEVTLTFEDTYFSNVLFSDFSVSACLPSVFVNTGQLALLPDAKLRAAVLCIQNGLMSLSDFDSRYRQKIKNYLGDSSSFVIDDSVKNDLSKTIVNYVEDLSRVYTDYSYRGM